MSDDRRRTPTANDIRLGLVKGRVRDPSVKPKSEFVLPFADALAAATRDDLLYAANLMTGHPKVKRTHRALRIREIGSKLEALRQEPAMATEPTNAPPLVQLTPDRLAAIRYARDLLAHEVAEFRDASGREPRYLVALDGLLGEMDDSAV